jgi:hypothetical protein
MKWIGERISFVDNKEKLTVVIYPPNIGFKYKLLVTWFVFWFAIGIYVTSQLAYVTNQKEQITLIIFLSFWLYFAVRVCKTLIYLTWGREYLKIDKEGLHIKLATGKYGKSKRYFLENLQRFDVIEIKDTSFQAVYESSAWVKGSNKISFEYLGKVYPFGRKLNEKDTTLLYKLMLKRIEQFIRQKD